MDFAILLVLFLAFAVGVHFGWAVAALLLAGLAWVTIDALRGGDEGRAARRARRR